jgi:glycosyltransferase involved in cell wall biosynthesis
MAQQKNRRSVTAVVAAFNEADRLGAVLDVLRSYPGFDEVITVDDGSTDRTSEVAASHGIHVIKHTGNLGKGRAIANGISAARGDIIFCSDADITGLTHEIIEEIIAPVCEGRVDMSIGMQGSKIYSTRPILFFTPLLSGQRAFTKEFWTRIPDTFKERFRVETALNFYAIHAGKSLQCKTYPDLRQKIKEDKYGFADGFLRRMSMYGDIIAANWMLHTRRFSFLRFYRRIIRSLAVRRMNIIEGRRYRPKP